MIYENPSQLGNKPVFAAIRSGGMEKKLEHNEGRQWYLDRDVGQSLKETFHMQIDQGHTDWQIAPLEAWKICNGLAVGRYLE